MDGLSLWISEFVQPALLDASVILSFPSHKKTVAFTVTVPFPSIFYSWNFYPTPILGPFIIPTPGLDLPFGLLEPRLLGDQSPFRVGAAQDLLLSLHGVLGSGRGGVHLFSDGDFTDFSGDFQAPQLAGKLSYCIHCLNPYFNRIYHATAGQHPNSQHPKNICWSIFECRENIHPWPPIPSSSQHPYPTGF